MKLNREYIKGFTLVEMILSLVLTAAATYWLMFTYVQLTIKNSKDELKTDIVLYSNRALDYIEEILNDITEPLNSPGSSSGFKSYSIEYSKMQSKKPNGGKMTSSYCEGNLGGEFLGESICIIEKNIKIAIDPNEGFVFREDGRDVTPLLIKDGGGIFTPNQRDPSSLSNIEYVIHGWGIEPLSRTNPKLFHHIHPMKAGAFTNSSYYIWVSIGIKNIKDPTVSDDPSLALYQVKMFDRISFSPSLFIRKFTSSETQDESEI